MTKAMRTRAKKSFRLELTKEHQALVLQKGGQTYSSPRSLESRQVLRRIDIDRPRIERD
jgi:hypothetical protein